MARTRNRREQPVRDEHVKVGLVFCDLPALDTGIDLFARTHTDKFVSIQCKLYAEDHTIQKRDRAGSGILDSLRG